jgi:tRNA G18 (ribose-2'-O)-methylase SpoU
MIEFRKCLNPQCGMRYPRSPLDRAGERCPRCLGETQVVGRRAWRREEGEQGERATLPLGVMLDNLRSAWNVGAIFRTADGLGVHRLYLCGITPTPPHAGIHKTALGAEEWVEWEYAPDAVEKARELKAQGMRLWGIEEGEGSTSLEEMAKEAQEWKEKLQDGSRAGDAHRRFPWSRRRNGSHDGGRISRGEEDQLGGQAAPILLILGNEIAGIDPELLTLCEQVIAIPMYGRKRSLNVEVAFAIAAWQIAFLFRRQDE